LQGKILPEGCLRLDAFLLGQVFEDGGLLGLLCHPGDFRAVLETNLFGVYYCCHEAIPLMKKAGGGYIINISSLAGANPHPRMAAYNASKFALNGFSEALMQEVRHDNIKVSYIMPGSVNTEFGGDSPSDEKSWQLTPADIARVVVDLLIATAGSGSYRLVDWPAEKKAIDIGDFYSDSSKIASTLGWRATTTLADGLKRTFEYYRAHFDQYVPAAGEQVASL